MFLRLEPWEERTTPDTALRAIIVHLRRELSRLPEAVIFPFLPPSIPGFGAAGGFNFVLQDRSGTLTVPQLGGAGAELHRQGAHPPGADRPLHRVRPDLAAVSTCSSIASRPGRSACRSNERLSDAVGVDGRHLRQRLQPVRTPLPGVRAGGRRIPAASGGHRQDLRAEPTTGDDDPALDARDRQPAPGHRARRALQPDAIGRSERAARPPASARRRRWRRSSRWRPRRSRPR